MKKEKTLVMTMAHALCRKFSLTISEALRKAWKAVKLQAALHLGKVEFAYRKADGSIRKAVGTLKGGAFSYTPSEGNSRVMPAWQIPYYDLEKMSFRSFTAINLI